MKNSEMQSRKILNYLYGNMDNIEKRLFETELEKNSNLKKEFLLQQEIDDAIRIELKVKNFKASLNSIHNNVIDKKESKILNLQNKWYWAAASITLISGTAIYSLKHHFQSPDYLFNSYYQVWQPTVVTRGIELEYITKNIIKEFEIGNFGKVITMLNKNYNDTLLSPKLLLLKGCAEMETKNYNDAIKTFSIFNSKDYTLYTEAGQWYQALCYLKNKNIDKAKQLLGTIIENNTSYANEAAKLIEDL